MNSPHPSTAWLPKLAAWFFWHSLYLVVVAAAFLSLSLFPELKVLFTGDVISNAWIESSIAVPLLLLLLPLFNILSLVESWKSGGWCSSRRDVVSSSLMKKRRARIHSHQKVQWTLSHCFLENNIAKSSLLYLGCSGSDSTTLWRRRRRSSSSSSSTPSQSFFGPCRPFPPTRPPLTTETFSLKDLPQKKKTSHTTWLQCQWPDDDWWGSSLRCSFFKPQFCPQSHSSSIAVWEIESSSLLLLLLLLQPKLLLLPNPLITHLPKFSKAHSFGCSQSI